MAMGMPYHEYWHGDVWAAKAYREAYEIRREQENFQAWLNGLYVYDAMAAVMAWSKYGSKLKRPLDYAREPYDLYGSKAKEDKVKADALQKQDGMTVKERAGVDFMRAFAAAHNRKLRENKEGTD